MSDVRVVLFVQTADAGAAASLEAAAAAAAAPGADAAAADALVKACACDAEFSKQLRAIIRERGSPRHVPSIIAVVPDVPKTNNGKKVEMAVMNVLRGKAVANRGSIANATVIDFYEALAPHLDRLLP